MFVWQVLNFLILAGGLGWLIVKQGGPLLAARSKDIADGLASGVQGATSWLAVSPNCTSQWSLSLAVATIPVSVNGSMLYNSE